MGADLHFLTIAKAAELIQTRKISPVELTQALLARVAELDPQINAFITVTAELALQQARQAQKEIAAGCYRGPLHGIPFGLKDLYYTAGILTSGHSRIGMSHIPGVDATTTAKLYQAGGHIAGQACHARVRARRRRTAAWWA